MKNTITALLLTTAPIFAGEPAPMIAPAPAPDCPQGWTIGLEAMAMKAYPGSGNWTDSNTDYEFAGRASIGYEFSDCMFVRATGFWFNSDLYDDTYDDGFQSVRETGDVEMSYYDLVVGQHFTPSDKLTLSPYVGLRWASLDASLKDEFNFQGEGPVSFVDRYETDFDGLGVVVGIDGTRSLGDSFSLYGTAKQAVLFGSTDYSVSSTEREYVGDSGSNDDVVFISELGLGLQYDFSFSNVAANARLGFEGQYWAGSSGHDGNNDIGLAGFVLGANFRF